MDSQLRGPFERLLKAGLHPVFAVGRKLAGLDPIKSLSVVLDFDHGLVAGLNKSLAVLGDRSVPLVIGRITRLAARRFATLLRQRLFALRVEVHQLTLLIDEISGQAGYLVKVRPIVCRDRSLQLEQGRLDLLLICLKLCS
ncbi:hypothetical protein AOX55_00004261 (plasmid) [Sinorhizobium fredii CCBAU 25509]|nr:hypothetical protein AOX55_00004261 [Sinorhizobium fredii CCBAU 25509]